MTTLKNNSGSKMVNISKDATGVFRAAYVQVYKGEQQALDFKSFTTEKKANSWGQKMLS